MKKKVIWSIIGILIVLGFINCDEDNNSKVYTVNIGTFTNGSITANPTSGIEGTEITLTIDPNNLYRLKKGSLKYGTTTINETTLKFNLPSSNITITAEFEMMIIGSWLTQNYDYGIITFNDNMTFYHQKDNTYYYLQKGI